ncbi:hypothetical protein Dsin_013827 [Dipteronia sinensis]|uniref:ADP-ribosyl cyclase/cyclic ADP-ribose hydrolase n=1 Tax=Dipteronia sinensis TaxID=43782 RepID=A0AAE0AL44_9ROSI|nr:hypothetical protein Dsin_013827 [Dipteronia sinensis]
MALISSTPQIKYDVFLSFRGDDTRNTFTSHLCKALCDKKIETFIDDKQLNRGDEISPSLLSAIEESHISIVIFSKNYASSTWCLEELEKIVECRKYHNQIVIPVFHEINPSDVADQTGSYAVAFAQHEQDLMESLDQVRTWKDALKQAANLSGFDSRVINYNKNLPGMNSRIEEIESLLSRGDVRSLGIWGIGGIGKTTLAKEVAKKISYQFESSGFAESVREHLNQGGLNSLKRSLLSTLLKDENAYTGTFIEKRLGRKKLLIILDDVTDFRQIEDLIGDLECLASESRIIVTSRDKQVLKNCRVDRIYQVEELCFNDAIKLFCKHSFRQNRLKVDYTELSNSVVEKVGGVPLALKVLGSTLFGKKKKVWESALKKLENNFDKDIHKVLKISYDELDDDEQSIFLDIACFFKGWNVDIIKVIIDACGFFDEVGISGLIDKSLITKSGNMLTMHDLLQAMGKEIVRQESTNDPSKRSRLWHHSDIYNVLTKYTGTEMIETISLNMSSSNVRDINLTPRAFANMVKLRLLNFYVNDIHNNCGNKVHVSEGLVEFDFTELKCFHWYGFPLKSLQQKFHFEKLVLLEMPNSNIEELWSDSIQPFHNLKRIKLNGSQHLISCPDFSRAPNLESLMLSKCTSLSEIPSSIQHLNKLESLYLAECKSLESLPDFTCLKSLKQLILDRCLKLKRLPQLPTNLEYIGLQDCTSLVEIQSSFTRLHKVQSLLLRCLYSLTSIPDLRGLKSLTVLTIWHSSKLKMLPELPNNIEVLTLKDVPIEEFPPSFEDLDRLGYLSIENCSMLKSLPSSVRKWKSLCRLELNNCSKIDKLPDDIGTLESLEHFQAYETPIREVPSSISCLKSLRSLIMYRCGGVDGVGLLLPPNLLGVENLSTLILSDCGITKLPDSFGDLTSLQTLDLSRNNFVSIPGSIVNLSKLESLYISYCERFRDLPQLPAWTFLKRRSQLAFQNDIYESQLGLVANFINCYNLDPDALNDFVIDTLLKIQGQVASLKKDTLLKIQSQVAFVKKDTQLEPYHNKQIDASGRELLSASVIYPGSKIPEWFHYQSRGSFVDVKLPPLWLNRNFLCFALCVAVAFPNPDRQCNHQYVVGHRYSKVTIDCNVKSKDGNRRVVSRMFGNPWYNDYCSYLELPMHYCGPDYMKSNHVNIGFGYYFFREFCDNEFSFQFNVKNCYWDSRFLLEDDKEHCKVEMCGVHLMSGQHLETSYNSYEEDELHLEESDEEDEPHPKRLKHIE